MGTPRKQKQLSLSSPGSGPEKGLLHGGRGGLVASLHLCRGYFDKPWAEKTPCGLL